MSRHVKPTIGRLPARDLSRSDVQRMIDAIAEGKTAGSFPSAKPRGKAVVRGGGGTAARVAELLGGIYSWGEEVASNALEVHVHHLRKKLGTEFIQTIRGVGYSVNDT